MSYIDSPDRIKTRKATINSVKDDDKSFQYTATVVLNCAKIGEHLEKISKIKPLINKCNQKRINYPSGKDDWKMFEKNTLTIAINVLYVKK